MKKILITIFTLLILSGCSLGKMDNTPTKQVEKYLNNYQILDSTVLTQLDSIVARETSFTDDQKKDYRDLLKKHYQDLTYNIKEETINGDKATVEVEIEVNDYTKALKESESYKKTNEKEFLGDDNSFDEIKFNDYKLNLLKDGKERVKYTLYFSLTKTDGSWNLDKLTEVEQEKMLGIYEY